MPPRGKAKLSLVAAPAPDPLDSAGRAWLAHLRAEGRSVKTLYDRERSLFAIVFPLLRELGVQQPEEISSRTTDELANRLAEGNRTASTVATYLRDLKAFLNWLHREGELASAPRVTRVAQPLRHPAVLTEQEYVDLLAAAQAAHPRDWLMVRVMGEAGLRASEVVGLGEEDLLELTGGRYQVRVVGKGNKERLVSLPPDLGRELRRYLRSKPGRGRMFLSRLRARGDYQPLDRNALTHLVQRLGITAGIRKPVHPHVLRHTFATRAAARGVDPLMLADQLGHTTLTMVRRYIQLSGQQQADRWDRIWKDW